MEPTAIMMPLLDCWAAQKTCFLGLFSFDLLHLHFLSGSQLLVEYLSLPVSFAAKKLFSSICAHQCLACLVFFGRFLSVFFSLLLPVSSPPLPSVRCQSRNVKRRRRKKTPNIDLAIVALTRQTETKME